MMNLTLYNSLTRKKESFTPLDPTTVRMYVCGITPYDYAHLGHGRSSINFDVLFRLLKQLYQNVSYVRNYTDIDDKIIAKAAQEGAPENFIALAQRYISIYQENMHQLNCLPPTYEPRVTNYIAPIINFIEGLVDAGKAYVIDHDVYFDISSFAHYGKLSGRSEQDLLAGARIDIDERKHNPGDFVLWKGNTEQKFWQSPWGYGRPGWHIECSVMCKELLGETIDIHGGGMDLLFPHHENEITQSESLTGKTFARYWLHNAFITINKEKMSKSLGNFITLSALFKQYDPMIFRYFILQHHYRTPIDFSDSELTASQTAYKKLIAAFAHVPAAWDQHITHPLIKQLMQALCDDLNTPRYLGIIFEHLSQLKDDIELAAHVRFTLQTIVGLTLAPLENTQQLTPEIQALLEEREQARKNKDWARADQIRSQLTAMGYQLHDKKTS